MNEIEITRIDLVEGGNVVKQGHHLTLGYVPRDQNGNVVDLTGKSIAVALFDKKKIIYEAPASFSNGVIRFTIDTTLESGNVQVEFTATSSDINYRQKFPTNTNEGRLTINRSSDDLDYFGVTVTTVDTLRKEQNALQQSFEGVIVPQVDELKQRVETGIGAFTEDTEVLDARQGAVNLGAKITEISYARMALEYGEIELPSDFRKVPFQMHRDLDGRVKHNYDFAKKRVGTEIFVNSDPLIGSDTTGTGTAAKPFQRIRKAFEVVAAGADSSYVIKCKSVRFDEGFHFDYTKTISDKKVAIIADNAENQVLLTTHQWNPTLVWTQDGTGVYKAARSAVYSVFDLRRKDVYGLPIPLENVATMAECQARTNTWYTDNVSVWIHASDGSMPNDANWVIGKSVRTDINLSNGAELYFENVKVLHGQSTYGLRVVGDGTTTFVNNDFYVVGGDLKIDSTSSNGLEIIDMLTTMSFRPKTGYTGRDGFNYHFAGIPVADRRKCLVVEFEGLSYKNGLFDASGNNNATTAHEGVCVLRVGCIGYQSTGPVLADVGGCYSICIDTHMRDSLKPESGTKAAFYFSDNGATVPGKAILINCDGGGEGYSVNTDASFTNLFIKGFRGINIPSSLQIKSI